MATKTASCRKQGKTTNFAAMEDLTQYLAPNDGWIATAAAEMGWDALAAYYNRVFLRLMQMPPGGSLDVAASVRPANYRLFLHCACTAIRELERMGIGNFYIEQQGNLILKR